MNGYVRFLFFLRLFSQPATEIKKEFKAVVLVKAKCCYVQRPGYGSTLYLGTVLYIFTYDLLQLGN